MKITEKIVAINDWWMKFSGEPSEFQILVEKRRELSALTLQLAKECANAKVNYDRLYGIRKISIAKVKTRLIDQGMTATNAEAKAKVECEEFILNEKENESAYYSAKIIIASCDNILSAMQQDISIYKNETN